MILKSNKSNKGFSLLEMLLTTGIIAGLLLVVFNLFEEYAENVLAKATAKYLNNISVAVEEILNDTNNFNIVYALADAETSDILELSFNDIKDGFAGIPASGKLNNSIREQTPLKTGVNIMVRIADNPSITTDTEALEIIVAIDKPVLVSRVRRVATILKSYGGFYIDTSVGIKSSFSIWRLDVSMFDGTGWGATIANPLTQPSLDNGSYVVHYKHINFDDVSGDYVYRNNVIGRPELNRMHTNLNMGGYNILGADNINVTDDLNISGLAIVNGSMNIGGDADVNKGNLIANKTLNTQNANILGSGIGTRGNFSIDDNLSINELGISRIISADEAIFNNGLITSGDLRANHVDFGNGFEAEGINATNLNSDGVLYDIEIDGRLNAANINTQSLSVGSNGIGTIDVQFGGTLSVLGGDIVSPDIGFENLNVTTFGACDQGC